MNMKNDTTILDKKINKEVKSTFWFSNGVSENYDNIIKKIAKAEGKKYVETPKND